MIWADIGMSELVPLALLGEGMTRIARLVLAISSAPNGLVLVDEVENGLHHTALSNVWKAVESAATQFNTQIVATTHSRECAEAAHDSLDSQSFRLHRLETDGASKRCITYSPGTVAAAMQHELEVR